MICIQKIYGFHGINRQNIEKSWYVTPVTNERTNGGKWKIGQCSVGPETAKKYQDQPQIPHSQETVLAINHFIFAKQVSKMCLGEETRRLQKINLDKCLWMFMRDMSTWTWNCRCDERSIMLYQIWSTILRPFVLNIAKGTTDTRVEFYLPK